MSTPAAHLRDVIDVDPADEPSQDKPTEPGQDLARPTVGTGLQAGSGKASPAVTLDAGPTPQGGRTIVIIPAWNEEDPLPGVLADLHETVPDLDIVVISDGSTDATAQVARNAGAAVVELPYNLGIGGALRTGFRYAVRNGYQRGVQFDADGQHDSSQIQSLLDSLGADADMVVGSRFTVDGGEYQVGKVRGGAMGLLRFTVRRITKQQFTDTSSGFRAFSLPVLEFFAETYPSEYMESVEALIMAHREGFSVREIPVRMRERQDGTPSNRNFKLLYHYLRLLLVIGASAGKRRRSRTGVAGHSGRHRSEPA